MVNPALWQLSGFQEARDRWIVRESPSVDLQFVVGEWILSRFDDPYVGVRREPDFPNLWFGPVPGTEFGGKVVCCSLFIEEREHAAKCDNFATLNLPV